MCVYVNMCIQFKIKSFDSKIQSNAAKDDLNK